MRTVGLFGASGFVGSAVCQALEARGVQVRSMPAPRLVTHARDFEGLQSALERPDVVHQIRDLQRLLTGCDVVVNAAGLALATGSGDDLFGANALLPGVLTRATPPGARFVHVSSAAVQGRRAVLDETTSVEPFSPYSLSKALGEGLADLSGAEHLVLYRPTSVQGAGRSVTRSLSRVASSPLASVAAPGSDSTPQVLVANVADAVAFLALHPTEPPRVVLHPWEGLTTAELVRTLGRREPLRVPRVLARGLITAGYAVGSRSGRMLGLVRRVDMLWFGQRQVSGWLEGRWAPVQGLDHWKDLS